MPRSASRAARVAVVLGALLAVRIVEPIGYAAAQDLDAPVTLYLEVFIAGVSTQLIASVELEPDGAMAMDPEDLVDLGLVADPSALRDDGLIDIARLPGTSFTYDAAAQTLDFEASMGARAPTVIDANRSAGGEPAPATAAFGALVNYSINVRFGDPAGPAIAGWLEPRLILGRFGTLTSGFVLNPAEGAFALDRLGTTFTHSNPDRMLTTRLGDVVTPGSSWSRSARLGGFQIERNFELRPDLVTFALPQFSGSAAVPSTVDVYINSIHTLSEAVGVGPFQITDVPLVAGSGNARVVVTDGTGQQSVTELPFFASTDLLRPGLLDFSLTGGVPRLGFGSATDSYSGPFMTSGSLRYGVAPKLTVEAHAEGGRGLVNGGVGAVAGLGNFGVASAAVSISRSAGLVGYQLVGGIQLSLGRLELRGTAQRTFGAFADIASVSAHCGGAAICLGAPPRAITQLSLSAPLGARTGFSISFTNAVQADGAASSVVGLSVSRSLGTSGSLFLSGYADARQWNAITVSAGFSISLGGRVRSAVNLDHTPAGTSVSTTFSNAGEGRIDGLAWNVRDTEGASSHRSIDLDYDRQRVDIRAGLEQGTSGVLSNLGLSGAIVLTGGGLFLANEVQDTFVVVDVGVPGIAVSYENRPAGETNARGRLLLPSAVGYQENHIEIDPATLPIDAAINGTTAAVVPPTGGAAIARFDIDATPAAALVTLRDGTGAFIPVGALAQLGASAAPTLVGYDGAAYVTGLAANNNLSVTLPDGGHCVASFAFVPSGDAQVMIEATCEAA